MVGDWDQRSRGKTTIGIGSVVKKKYKIIKILGEGGFGVVFEVQDLESSNNYALKMELKRSKKNADSDFHNEAAVLKKMSKKIHFVEFIDMGVYNGFCFLVMQLLGSNLSQLKKMRRDSKFSTSTSLRLSLQCFEAIESLHEIGLIHRDIKPTNFAIGCKRTDRTRVYLLDFGLVRRYLNPDGTHRRSRGRVPFRGTVKYSSINALSREDQSPRDDLISWFYQLVEFRLGILPWQNEHNRMAVLRWKEEAKQHNLLTNTFENELKNVHNSLFTLEFHETPPYNQYRQALQWILMKNNMKDEDPYDWELDEGGLPSAKGTGTKSLETALSFNDIESQRPITTLNNVEESAPKAPAFSSEVADVSESNSEAATPLSVESGSPAYWTTKGNRTTPSKDVIQHENSDDVDVVKSDLVAYKRPPSRGTRWNDAFDDFGLFGQQYSDQNLWPYTRRRSPNIRRAMVPTVQQGGGEVINEEDKFTVNIDVSHFAPEEVKVKVVDNNLIVEGKHEERMDQHGFVARTFSRRYVLPKDVDQKALKSNLSSNGVLSIEAPKLVSEVKAKERSIPIQFGQQPSAIAEPRKTS